MGVISESKMEKISKNFKNKIKSWNLSPKSYQGKLIKLDMENLSTHFENKLLGIVEKNSVRNKNNRILTIIRIRKGQNNLSNMKSKFYQKPKKKKFFNSQHEFKSKRSLGNKNIKFSQGMKIQKKTSLHAIKNSNTQNKKINSQSKSKKKILMNMYQDMFLKLKNL